MAGYTRTEFEQGLPIREQGDGKKLSYPAVGIITAEHNLTLFTLAALHVCFSLFLSSHAKQISFALLKAQQGTDQKEAEFPIRRKKNASLCFPAFVLLSFLHPFIHFSRVQGREIMGSLLEEADTTRFLSSARTELFPVQRHGHLFSLLMEGLWLRHKDSTALAKLEFL